MSVLAALSIAVLLAWLIAEISIPLSLWLAERERELLRGRDGDDRRRP